MVHGVPPMVVVVVAMVVVVATVVVAAVMETGAVETGVAVVGLLQAVTVSRATITGTPRIDRSPLRCDIVFAPRRRGQQ